MRKESQSCVIASVCGVAFSILDWYFSADALLQDADVPQVSDTWLILLPQIDFGSFIYSIVKDIMIAPDTKQEQSDVNTDSLAPQHRSVHLPYQTLFSKALFQSRRLGKTFWRLNTNFLITNLLKCFFIFFFPSLSLDPDLKSPEF